MTHVLRYRSPSNLGPCLGGLNSQATTGDLVGAEAAATSAVVTELSCRLEKHFWRRGPGEGP
jgi:hypothetical protein